MASLSTLMDDRGGITRCRINHEVLDDYAKSQRNEERDAAQLFEAIRPIIEEAASAAYDKGIIDKEGRVLVTTRCSQTRDAQTATVAISSHVVPPQGAHAGA